MTHAARQAVSALVAFSCTAVSLALLRAAGLPFPPALAWAAVPQWLVFAAVVHATTRLGFHLAGRVAPALARPAAD